MTFGTLAFALGSATGKRGTAAGIASAVAVAAYLLNTLAMFVDWIETLSLASPFHYNNSAAVLIDGLAPMDAFVLTCLTTSLLLVAIVTFERRDLGVG